MAKVEVGKPEGRMTIQNLPVKLKKEPLVDAIFEIRFSSSQAASTVLPGFFFAKLLPVTWRIETLPMAEIPNQLRSSDPKLRYQPLMRIHWDDFILMIGDRSLGVACKMPYIGWSAFKNRIVHIFKILFDAKVIQTVERYSLKYVDVVSGKDLKEQIARVNIDLRVGSHTINQQLFTIRVEIPHDNFRNVIQIAADVTAKISDGQLRKGSLVDIDTICTYNSTDLSTFANELPERLEAIHIENKKMFFDCLKPETIEYLEPVYG